MFRAYARFGLGLILVVGILAGLGVDVLLRCSRRGMLYSSVLIATAALELMPFPPWRWRDVLPTSGHRWLVEQPLPRRVLDCVPATLASERTVYSLFDGPIELLNRWEDCGEPAIAQKLSAKGFTHMIVRKDSAVGRWLEQRPTPSGLLEMAEFDDARIFESSAPAPPLYLEIFQGFHCREYARAGTYRWMTERGELALTNTTGRVQEATLEVTLQSFPRQRRVDIEFEGQSVAEIVVVTEPTSFELGPLQVRPGRHILTLRARTAAAIPDEFLHNGDHRSLTIALWEWRWSF